MNLRNLPCVLIAPNQQVWFDNTQELQDFLLSLNKKVTIGSALTTYVTNVDTNERSPEKSPFTTFSNVNLMYVCYQCLMYSTPNVQPLPREEILEITIDNPRIESLK